MRIHLNCLGLKNAVIEAGTSDVTLGAHAFYNCKNLEKLTLPANVASVGEYVFIDCGITELTLPQSVTCIGQYRVETYAYTVKNNSGYSGALKTLTENMTKLSDSVAAYLVKDN